MGHASITTTLDLYGHLYPGEMDRYADRLDDAAGITDAAKMRPDDEDASMTLRSQRLDLGRLWRARRESDP